MSVFTFYAGEGLICRSAARCSGADTTEVEAHMATYFWFVLLQITNEWFSLALPDPAGY